MTTKTNLATLGPYVLGPDEDENCGIYTGDAKILSEEIPDESVDLIFTDPEYSRIEDYEWLARVASRVLKPNRACLAWTSKVTLPQCQEALERGGLNYQSVLFYVVQAKQAMPIFPYGLIPWTTPCLVFAKGRYQCQPFIPDTFCTGKASQTDFKWQKNTEVMVYWLRSFLLAGGVVLDPFTGLGSVPAACKIMNHRYLAFEIDPSTADRARQRVQQTQPPIIGFNEAMAQLSLEMDDVK